MAIPGPTRPCPITTTDTAADAGAHSDSDGKAAGESTLVKTTVAPAEGVAAAADNATPVGATEMAAEAADIVVVTNAAAAAAAAEAAADDITLVDMTVFPSDRVAQSAATAAVPVATGNDSAGNDDDDILDRAQA
jgi:hypothetical protein